MTRFLLFISALVLQNASVYGVVKDNYWVIIPAGLLTGMLLGQLTFWYKRVPEYWD